MNIVVRLFIAGLLLVSAFAFNSTAFAQIDVLLPENISKSSAPLADIEVFVRNGCPHCAKAELFLLALKRERPALNIVIHDVSQIVSRVIMMVKEKKVISIDGKEVPIDAQTICVHGDTPGAVDMVKALRQALDKEGIQLKPFGAA